MLLPTQGQPLAAHYNSHYVMEMRVDEFDYLVASPDQRKQSQLFHVNMLKPYYWSNSQQESLVSAVEEVPLLLLLGSEGEEPDNLGLKPIVSTN